MAVKDFPFLSELGLNDQNDGVYFGKWTGNGPVVDSLDPSTGKVIASVREVNMENEQSGLMVIRALRKTMLQLSRLLAKHTRFGHKFDALRVSCRLHFPQVPAPKRGEIVRQIGDALREKKKPLGQLVGFLLPKQR